MAERASDLPLQALEEFAQERLAHLATSPAGHHSVPFVRAMCQTILDRVSSARAAIDAGDADTAALKAMEATELHYIVLLSDDLEPVLSTGNKVRKSNRENRSKRAPVIDTRTRTLVVSLWDSATRQGEEQWAFIERTASARGFELPSRPTIRNILRAADRIPPAKSRK